MFTLWKYIILIIDHFSCACVILASKKDNKKILQIVNIYFITSSDNIKVLCRNYLNFSNFTT